MKLTQMMFTILRIVKSIVNIAAFVAALLACANGHFVYGLLLLLLISKYYVNEPSAASDSATHIFYFQNIVQRVKAIWYALYFGLMPYRYYEKECHYTSTYWEHLFMNLGYALKWLLFLESANDRQFETEVNGAKP